MAQIRGAVMKRRWLVVVGLLIVAGSLAIAPVKQTVASWTDSEYATGSFVATVIQPPVMTGCSLSPGLLGTNPVITVTWQFPLHTPTYVTPGNAAYFVAQSGLLTNLTSVLLGTNLTTTGPVSGVYTTQFRSGILGGLLGGSYGVYLQTVDASGWTSTLAAALASMGLAGINPQCTVQ